MMKRNILLSIGILAVLLVSATTVSAADELPKDLVVVIDDSHTPQHADSYGNITEALEDAESEIDVITEFEVSEETNVLIIPASTANYTADELDEIKDWFDAEEPRLLWVAGDSDYGGYFTPEFSTNAILAKLESQLRIGAESVSDAVSNDGASYRVFANDPQDDGDINEILTDGVDGCVFHGPSPIVGYTTTVVDLRTADLDDVEIIMKSSADALSQDGDGSDNEFDFYEDIATTGGYPMMAIETMDDDKFILVSGECTFSDYKAMYGEETEGGLDTDGEKLVNNILIWFGDDHVGGFLPLAPYAAIAGLLVTAVVIRRRN